MFQLLTWGTAISLVTRNTYDLENVFVREPDQGFYERVCGNMVLKRVYPLYLQ